MVAAAESAHAPKCRVGGLSHCRILLYYCAVEVEVEVEVEEVDATPF